MIDLYINCNTVRLFSLCLPLTDVGIDSLQEHLEIHLQKYSIRLVVFCLEECRPKNPRQHLHLCMPCTFTPCCPHPPSVPFLFYLKQMGPLMCRVSAYSFFLIKREGFFLPLTQE